MFLFCTCLLLANAPLHSRLRLYGRECARLLIAFFWFPCAVQVEDGKKLGEWAGLCKIDKEGNARKVVGCSSVVVKDWGDPDADAIDVLQNYFKTA